LALTRAIIKNRIEGGNCVLILDEATSKLDMATENMVKEIIREELKANTVISVAHRVDFLKDCSVILLLDEGRIVKVGNFKDVIGHSGCTADNYPDTGVIA
jgi:ABC-type multidrug transport system fused ATPase/permease subunit